MNDLMLAYMAGYFDGEGSIYIQRAKRTNRWTVANGESKSSIYYTYILYVSIANRSSMAINLLKNSFGSNVTIQKKANPKEKSLFRWRCSGINAETFLRAIAPFSIGKTSHISVALQFRSTKTNEEKEICKLNMNILNRKGKHDNFVQAKFQ